MPEQLAAARDECTHRKAQDILRASQLPLLGADNKDVRRTCTRPRPAQALSLILLVRGDGHHPLIIADGYHRVCQLLGRRKHRHPVRAGLRSGNSYRETGGQDGWLRRDATAPERLLVAAGLIEPGGLPSGSRSSVGCEPNGSLLAQPAVTGIGFSAAFDFQDEGAAHPAAADGG